MPSSKKSSRANRSSGKVKAGNRPGKPADGVLRTDDVVVEQGLEANELAAAVPFNATKKFEYGHDNATAPRAGTTVKPSTPALTASTQSEDNASAKTGGAAAPGVNATNAALDRVRADAGGQALTTNQGVQIADNQNSLKAGLRGPTLLEDFILREKITHFDHERIPERIVHARGSMRYR